MDKIDELRNNAQNSEKKFRYTNGEKIPNQYIVVLKDDDFLCSTRSPAVKAASEGAELKHIYQHAIRGFAVKVPNEKLLVDLAMLPEVDYIQPDVKAQDFAQTLPHSIL